MCLACAYTSDAWPVSRPDTDTWPVPVFPHRRRQPRRKALVFLRKENTRTCTYTKLSACSHLPSQVCSSPWCQHFPRVRRARRRGWRVDHKEKCCQVQRSRMQRNSGSIRAPLCASSVRVEERQPSATLLAVDFRLRPKVLFNCNYGYTRAPIRRFLSAISQTRQADWKHGW